MKRIRVFDRMELGLKLEIKSILILENVKFWEIAKKGHQNDRTRQMGAKREEKAKRIFINY